MLPSRFLLRGLGTVVAATLAACIGNNDAETQVPPVVGDTFGLTSSNRLVWLDADRPAVRNAIAITGLQSGDSLVGIDIRPGGSTPGELYALGTSGRLYTVNIETGVATFRSMLTADGSDPGNPYTMLDGTEFGVDFNPLADRLRVVSNTGQNLRINVDTGATITDGNLNTSGALTTGVSAAAYTNSFAAACRTALFYLSAEGDRLLTTSDPNAGTLQDVGALGVNAGGNNAFEIYTNADGTNAGLALVNTGGNPVLHRVNLVSGAVTNPMTITGLNSGETLLGLTVESPATAPAQAPGNLLAVTNSNRLISFNSAAPQKLCTTAAITGMQAGENALGIDARPADGDNYVLGSTGRLYTLTATGAATLKSTLAPDVADATSPFMALEGSSFGVDFNPVPDRLRVVSDTGQNLRINVDTGATITDTLLNPAGSSISGAAYTDSFAGAGTTVLYGIDTAGDRLVIQGQPSGNPDNGDLQPVGTLGVADVQAVSGFDIDGRNNNAFAALNPAGATTSDLYAVDLASGAATRINVIGGGEPVRGIALPSARALVHAMTADNRLVSFRVGSPGTYESSVTITGLGSETILGADIRPANGALLVLTDAGRLHRLDLTSGAATPLGMLAADATDMSSPFTGLTGNTFGVDFNPTVDRLRIVSTSGLNLRTNVETGATITDGVLARTPAEAGAPPPMLAAAAYTRSFAGTDSTQLFGIDAATLSLQLQSPPNDGVLTTVGALDLQLTSATAISFDIAGGANGLSLATMVPAGAAQSTLYRINLATGAATTLGVIGQPGAAPLRAMVIQLQ